MRGNRFFRPMFAALTAGATLVAYTGLSVPASPARAADPETTRLLALLDGLEQFVPTLADVGALGEAVPTLGVEPGSDEGLGLGTLIAQARGVVLTGSDHVDGAADVDEFVDRLDGASGPLGDGRTITFTANETTPGAINVGITVTRNVESSLDILGDEPIGPGYPAFSLTSDDGVDVDLELSAAFVMNYVEGGSEPAWLSDPTLSLTVDADFVTPVDIDGGVGILGIRLGTGSVFDLSATLTGAFQDPNNDGRLYFDEPGGTSTSDGELSAAGAGAGLVTVGLTDGTVAATLDIEAADSTAISLPSVDAQVTVTGDLDQGTLDVGFASGAFDSVRGFLNLSTRDLAQGLASAATSVLALQNATGVELPFMRGDYANAVGAVQAITDFLALNVPEPDPDDATPGLPEFTSLQDLLEQLEDPAEIPGDNLVDVVPGATYDADDDKIRFTLQITRAAEAGAVDLNPTGEPLSGANATYTATTLTAPGQDFDPTLAGRQVVAGTSSGIIASAGGDTLTLDPGPVTSTQNPSPTNFWVGGTPAAGSGYSIAAGDAKIGAVELANALEDDAHGAITNANAKLAQAQVTPSFSLTLPIVLDLSDPDTSNCNPDGTPVEPCPYSHTANGITQIIESLPRTADRVMLDVDGFSFTADADITTAVDVDATVGFLAVKVKGTLKACTVSAGVDDECIGTRAADAHLLSLGLKALPGADADGDIAFSRLIEDLTAALNDNTPGSVLDLQVAGQAYANLTVEVPGAAQFFGGTSPTASIEIKLPDVTHPETFTVTPGTNIGDLGSFNLDADNPLALFGALLANLQAVQETLGDFPGSGALDTEIPLVGKSLNEVIGAGAAGGGEGVTYTEQGGTPPTTTTLKDTGKTFDATYVGRTVRFGSQEARVASFDPNKPSELVLKPALVPIPTDGAPYTTDSELQGLINTLQDTSSNSLQEMLATLADRLGAGSTATFEVLPGTPDTLKLKLHWERSYVHQAPLDLKFDFPSGTERSLIGAQATGQVTTTASGAVDLALLIPLDVSTFNNPAAALKVDPEGSELTAAIDVQDSGLNLAANLGPFEATLGEGELKANLGVALSGNGTGPQTLTEFAANVGLAVTGTGVECADDGIESSVELAVCAVFPMKINGIDAGTTPETSNLVVRLPLNTSDLADTLNPLGDIGTGNGSDTVPRVGLPDNLTATLAQAGLSLLSFGDGFTGYLEFAERALRAASFDGKLPLVGKDLQVGADFIGGVRTEIETAFADAGLPTDTTAQAIRTFAHGALEDALPTVGPALTIDVTCTTPLASAGAPTVTKVGSGTGPTYRYKIVALTKVTVEGGVQEERPTVTGAESGPYSNVAVEDMDNENGFQLTWGGVTRATGYYVLRSVNGGAFFQVGKTVAPKFDDYGAAAGDPDPDVAESDRPCPDSTPANEVTGFSIGVTLGQGNPTAAGCDTGCIEPDPIPVDFGIPGLSLKATDATDGVDVSVGWRLDLELVFDRTAGFYVDTQESADPEFLVGASLRLPAELQAQLAFLNITATDNDTTAPEFAGLFSIDLHDTDGQLSLDQVISPQVTDFVAVSLTANVDIDLHLAAGADSALPGIETDFLLTWGWTSAAPSDIGGLTIAFNNVSLNAGDFLGGVIAPVVDMVVDVFKPVQPVIDTLFEKIPVLSDLSEMVGGDPITIASLANTFSTLADGPDLQPFLDVLKNIRDLVKALDSPAGTCATPPCLDVGDFKLVSGTAIETDANPSTADSLIDKSPASGYNKNDGLLGDLNDKSPADIDNNGADEEHPGFSFPFLEHPEKIFGLIVGQDVELVKFDSGPLTLGFEFQQSFGPVYAPPPVNIVVGGGASVSLQIVAGFDTYGIRTAIENGKADAGILDSLFFYTTDDAGKPIPVVQFEGYLQAGASVSLVVIEVGVVGGVKLTIGFFWNDPNNDGKFRFMEFLAAALNNPICLFNVGGELSLFIKVFITLGFSPFSVSFDFTLVEVVLLEFNLKPDCEPPPPNLAGVAGDTLYLFAGDFGDKAQRAQGHSGDYPFDNDGGAAEESWVIRQHAAKPAVPATPDPDGDDGPEKGKPAQSAEPAKITVTALGISEDFPDPGGDTIKNVVLEGRYSTGKLQVTFNGGDAATPFDKKVVMRTGSGDDVIRTGIGSAVIDSGGGQDQVTTMERTDLSIDPETGPTALVSGGPGVDTITVGNGRNTVLGDASLNFTTNPSSVNVLTADGKTVALSGVLSPTGATVPADPDEDVSGGGADQIAAGLGGSTIYGNNGDDKIGTANDNPQAALGKPNPDFYRAQPNRIVGGSGGDRIKSGSASDVIFTGFEDEITQDEEGSGDTAATQNSVDTGEGSDTVYGSNGQDFVTTHSIIKDGVPQTATVFGGGAPDVLIGGAGTDKLYGGRDNDHLVAGPASVGPAPEVADQLTALSGGLAYKVELEPLPAPVSAKLLVGGGGKDRIYGVDGPAVIFGDHEGVDCVRQSDPVSKQPTENPVVAPDPVADRDDHDLILGGAGVDIVNAGGGYDHVELYGADDVACGSGGNDTVFGGNDEDLVYGGSGDDKLYGDNHPDEVFGNDGDDSVFGGVGDDRLQGNNHSDFVAGGADSDLIVGGTSKAGEPDADDRLYGDEGTDTLIGDNADAETLLAYPADLADGSVAPATGGADYVYGGVGDDLAYGGLRDDHVYGGTGDDQLEGNNASDHVFGEAGKDNVIGGSSEIGGADADGNDTGRPDGDDFLYGGLNDDVVAGDNAQISRSGPFTPITEGRSGVTPRAITLLDLGYAADADHSGEDQIFGGPQDDVLLGQDDADEVNAEGGEDYAEGGQANDIVRGGSGQDDLVGGSHVLQLPTLANPAGQPDGDDTVHGGSEADVILGDNGQILHGTTEKSDITKNRTPMTERLVEIYDLGDTPQAGTSGADWLLGEQAPDVILAQSDTDRITGGDAEDFAEGGPGRDWIEGNDGDDDLVGGSSARLGAGADALRGQPDDADVIWGQSGDDLVLGDNAVVSRTGDMHELTYRIGTSPAGEITDRRAIELLDLNAPDTLVVPAGRFGADFLSGQAGVDVLLAQDGKDAVSGGSADDYAEGQGDADAIFGDASLVGVPMTPDPEAPATLWPGAPTSPDFAADGGADGQDDLIGGKSEAEFRDGGDTIHGNGESDFVLGDNGTAVRQILDEDGVLSDRLYLLRYSSDTTEGRAKIRVADSDFPSTRFCDAALDQCERVGAFGSDTIYGHGGDDFLYGQDADDSIWGGAEDDDIYGELGSDRLFGEAGDDAILGDRGGVRDRYELGADTFNQSVTQVPKVSYQGFTPGSVTRITDLLHDVDGDVFVGAGAADPMPHNGRDVGGDDRIRGGLDDDSIHAGFGDDLANGDSGGDIVFGDDGADVLWGGKGCDAQTDDQSSKPYCYAADGTFDPAPHQADGSTVPAVTDYLLGGKGGTSQASLDGALGSDVLDWRPRGSYNKDAVGGCTSNPWPTDLAPLGKKGVSTTVDPCSWFEMTDIHNDVAGDDATTADNQHHQGIDWQYGGWDRDVLQADVADNGPNEGDRLLDWDGAFNLYTHCNAAYGGFNDVRQHSPTWMGFLQQMVYGLGAGQQAADAETDGTSSFVELALVYPGKDREHGSGKAYPATPGHFDDPNACAP